MTRSTQPAANSQNTAPFETIRVQKAEVACDGGKGPEGHPRVFLYIDREKGSVTCPYCSRHYLQEGGHASSH